MNILLIAYDDGSHISWFPNGLAYIAAVCRQAGHTVQIYNQDVYHWPEAHLEALLNREKFDVVGIGAVGGYYQYRKIDALSKAIRKAKHRPLYVLGGHLVSPEPAYFLQKYEADVIVIGEGERTIVDLLDAVTKGQGFSEVAGIAYRENNQCIVTPKRELIQDVDSIPMPAWDLFPMDHYALLRAPRIQSTERCLPVYSGRGCTFTCNFCYRMDQGFRPRSADSILAEIEILNRVYGIDYILFADELLMSSPERTYALCEAFLKARVKFRWCCNGRLNYAQPEVLRLMREAGCVFINYGIESMDESILRVMNKALTVKQITTGIENTLAAGISPGYNIIFGNIGETAAALQLGVDFLLKYDDHSQLRTIRPVTPYPGSPLYDYAIEKGLLKDCEDFYENKHVNSDLLAVNFTKLSDAEFHRCLYEANEQLIKNYYAAELEQTLERARKLYFEQDTSFRGFR